MKQLTIIEESEFKGNKVITIWSVEENGEKSKYPIISFGLSKAKEILIHIDKIKEFVEKNVK